MRLARFSQQKPDLTSGAKAVLVKASKSVRLQEWAPGNLLHMQSLPDQHLLPASRVTAAPWGLVYEQKPSKATTF